MKRIVTSRPTNRLGTGWFRRGALATLSGLLLIGACSRDNPMQPELLDPDGQPPQFAAAICTIDLGDLSLSCQRPGLPAPPPGLAPAVMLGDQGENITFSGSGASFSGGTFSIDVTVQNLIGQAIGTTDGTTVHADGVRSFFSTEPFVSQCAGTVVVANHDGTATFTESNQKFHEYAELLDESEISQVWLQL